MRTSIDTTNLPKIFVASFGHEIYLKTFSIQKILRTFNYSYNMQEKMTSRVSLSTCSTILDYVLSSLKNDYINLL